jgi:uncharacterized repeat protein (TIGR03803 family)
MACAVYAQDSGLMVTTLANFNGTNGNEAYGDLVIGNDGLFYGGTLQGGDFGEGNVFKTTLDGCLTSIFSFNGTNGASPVGLTKPGPDGSFYGIAGNGGNGFNGSIGSGYGSIFGMTSNGVMNTLLSFNGSNGIGPNSIVLATDGNLYGTTYSGGAFSNIVYFGMAGGGTAFKMTTNGDFTLLASFDGTNYGEQPRCLTQASDGNFYGGTTGGGAFNLGTLFRMTPDGQLTTLVSFDGTIGFSPSGPLTQGSDGALYGITFNMSSFSGGSVYRITTNGDFTNLVTFGSWPRGRLVEVSNGVFYGTDYLGGWMGAGNLFRVTTNGDLTKWPLFHLSTNVPWGPLSGLVKGPDDNFYGEAQGPMSPGSLYCIRPIEAPVLHATTDGSQITLSWKAWAGHFYVVEARTNVNDTVKTAPYGVYPKTNGITSYSEPIEPGSQRFYRVLLSPDTVD